MTYFEDLQICDYFPFESNANLIAVGWLEKDHEFNVGAVDESFYRKLSELLRNPWQPVVSAGPHECSLCQFGGFHGTGNLFVPYNGKIYVAPELIPHYINCHHYRPPDIFIAGVMECANTRSMEYKKLFLSNGGRALIKSLR